jgi:hypothetical protein
MSRPFSTEERALLRGESLPAPESMHGWYPVVVRARGVWWRYLGDKRFEEPFFHDTLRNLPADERYTTWTPWERLSDEGDIAPTAFIFHVSRCGSTLLTQLLATERSCIALSEPPVIDSCLRQEGGCSESAMRKTVAALGQQRSPTERHLFIKLDSWHIGSLPLFRRVFPQTPFLFLYREPAEVLASHRRLRGRQMVPDLVEQSMVGGAVLEGGDIEGYGARVLEHFYASAVKWADELLLIDYRQLPQVAWTELAEWLSLSQDTRAIAAMQARATLHSKTSARFTGDGPVADAGIEAACAAITPYYEALERRRLGRR